MQQITSSVRPQHADTRKLVEDVHHVLGVLRRGWRFVAIAIAVCVTTGVIYLAKTRPEYHASTQLLVLQQGGRPISVAGTNDPIQQIQGAKGSLSTHLMIITSPVIVERALQSAGLKNRSVESVIQNLTVIQPDKTANIIEVAYRAGTLDEAVRVVRAVVESYELFLKENYQQSASQVIALIVEARDELGRELQELEQEYLDFRKNSPSYSADQGGRTFAVRRLDQWDQAANQAMARTLQLKTQLELAQRLIDEGASLDAITGSLNQLGGLGGGAAIELKPSVSDQTSGTGASYELLTAELTQVEAERQTAERLLENLRAEHEAMAAGRSISEAEVARVFSADPEVSRILDELNRARMEKDRINRVALKPSDPSLRHNEQRIGTLKSYLDRLWQEKKPAILESLRTPDTDEVIRKAEVELLALKAREATLRERAEQVRSEQLRWLNQEYEQLVRDHGPDDPKTVASRARIEKLERGPAHPQGISGGRTATLIGSLKESLKAIEAMRAEIQQRFNADLDASREAEITLLAEANLRSNLDRQRTLFDSVASQLKQAQLVGDFESVVAQTIKPPSVLPVRPKIAFVMLLALVAGCGLGGGVAFAAELLDARVRSLSEMRTILDMPVLAVIPQLSFDQAPEAASIAMLSHRSPRSSLAESYKSARTNLEFLRRNRSAQVLLISSPNPGDGKSTTASNLAISLAHAGRRVLLIDGDLRKPSLHIIFDVDQQLGLTLILKEHTASHEVVQPSMVENLDLLTAGPDVSNPAELLSSDRFGEFLDAVRPSYDVIIIDSSPLLAVTDPSILSASVDGVLLVTRLANDRRQDVERAIELLKTLGTPVLGAMINGITREQGGYGLGYGYGAGYGRPYGTSTSAGMTEPSAPKGQIELTPAADENHHHLSNGTAEHRA